MFLIKRTLKPQHCIVITLPIPFLFFYGSPEALATFTKLESFSHQNVSWGCLEIAGEVITFSVLHVLRYPNIVPRMLNSWLDYYEDPVRSYEYLSFPAHLS